MENIKVGIAAVDYTPEIGLPLMGNFRDDYASRGMHGPLYARAMVFSSSAATKVVQAGFGSMKKLFTYSVDSTDVFLY